MPREEWPILLYRNSVLKQRKFKEITALLGATKGLMCLDIGGDNGVISYLLRRRGGKWSSADLEESTVSAIRELVRDSVFQIDGRRTSFQDKEFDRVVIVDFLEHIETDRDFIEELFRVMKPKGELIINVPCIRESVLRKLRIAIGQTDEKHGHVRPGYTVNGLQDLLGNCFTLTGSKTYSKFFSECIDTLISLGFGFIKTDVPVSRKGVIVTGQDLGRHRKILRVYLILFPLVWIFCKLDALLFWCGGYMLIAKATVNKS